jgi:alpha-beta hydrolase superfamily lysophospholipase
MKPSSEETLVGARSRRIVFRCWLPEDRVEAVIVIAHGYGEHGGRYEHVAQRLVEDGHAVFVPDHHGHGRSDGPRGRISLHDAAADLSTVIDLAAGRNPEGEVFVLGHSMGGALALRYAMAHQDRIGGLILSAPLAEVDGHEFVKAAARAIARVAPGLPLTRIDPKLISRDAAVVQAYADDPLVYHRGIPAATVAEFLMHVETLPEDVRMLTLPTLLMYGTEDKLVAPAGSVMISQRIESPDLTTTPYPGLSHEILNEPEREQVLDQICGWVGERAHATMF